MTIWAISDLHLSHANPRRLAPLPPRWNNHVERMRNLWSGCVAPRDLVLIPGDLSLATNHRDVQPDLDWLHALPGRKVLSPGNHDVWWNKLEPVRRILRSSMYAVDGDAIEIDGVIVCGARACAPSEDQAAASLSGLGSALTLACGLRTSTQPIYVLWHYPPFDRHGTPTDAARLMIDARVTACAFGHIHQLGQWSTAAQHIQEGIPFRCVAADALGFRPLKLNNGDILNYSTPR